MDATPAVNRMLPEQEPQAPTMSLPESLAELGIIPPLTKGKGPRPASSYRAHRRNHVKAHRQLPAWRQFTAGFANQRAKIAERAVVANGAREAAAKAIVEANAHMAGLPQKVIALAAMGQYYESVERTRPVQRILRELRAQIRVA